MTSRVKIGVIGTSWWTTHLHLPSLEADDRVELAAICGHDRRRAEETAARYGIRSVYTDCRAMVDRANLEAVLIVSPDDQHHATAMAAMDGGLHVLCDKPLASNALDARAMYDCARSRGLLHLTYFIYRWLPEVRYARELIDQGTVGRVYHCELCFESGYGRCKGYRWRFNRKRANGVLGDLGSHMFDLARYLVGDVGRVSGSLGCHVERVGPDGMRVEPANDTAAVLMEFANGAHGVVRVSALARVQDEGGMDQWIVVHGDKGSLCVRNRMTKGAELYAARGEAPLKPVAIPERYYQGVDRTQPPLTQSVQMFSSQPIGARLFVDGILDHRPVTPSFYDGWKAQQLVDAAIESHEKGRWVDVG